MVQKNSTPYCHFDERSEEKSLLFDGFDKEIHHNNPSLIT